MRKLSNADFTINGFKASGVRSGIKQQGLDLALIYSEVPAVSAGLFTTNAFRAAPVIISSERAARGKSRAIVANAGNANACTGERGMADARKMASIAAERLGVDVQEIMVCSTGVIGHFLDMNKIESGITDAAGKLSSLGISDVARAIMTTDTRPKSVAYEVELAGSTVRIGGVAKGSGMICPNVATMFCFIMTDAAIDAGTLRLCAKRAVDGSFNSLTIDGDTSTNDSIIMLANGLAGNSEITSDSSYLQTFQRVLDAVCQDLAREMARDGEGATKLVEVIVNGARNYQDAKSVAMTVANSPLVKTAVFGEDPNWGRALAAAGRSGADIDPNRVDLFFGDVKIVSDGSPIDLDAELSRKPMLESELAITIDLKLGDASAKTFTCDFSYDYIKINAEYHT